VNIGITYDLKSEYLAKGHTPEQVAELDDEATVDAIHDALESLGHSVDRIGGIEALTKRLASGQRWDLVFNICEGMIGATRESQVPALLEAWGIAVTFSDSAVLALTLDKAHTKLVLQSKGVATARFSLVEEIQDVDGVALEFPLFVKPVAEGSSKGIDAHSKVDDRDALRAQCRFLLKEFHQPVLVEEYLPGEEFTVGLLGTGDDARILGVSRIRVKGADFPDHYSRELKTIHDFESVLEIELSDTENARRAGDVALRAWKVLKCRDAGRIDVRLDRHGEASVIEANPLAGLVPGFSDLCVIAMKKGMPYRELVGCIVDSAAKRANPGQILSNGNYQRSELCVILHNEIHPGSSIDEKDVLDQVELVEGALASLGKPSVRIPVSADLGAARRAIEAASPRFAFCLVESFAGYDSMSHVGPALLEQMGIPFSGCGSKAFQRTSDKVLAKAILRGRGVPTPDWVTESEASITRDVDGIEFLLKPRDLDGSLHIAQGSIVRAESLVQLRALLADLKTKHCTEFFAEEFIDGREINVSLLGDGQNVEILDPAEIVFENFEQAGIRKIVSYYAKWLSDTFEYQHVTRTFDLGSDDETLAQFGAMARECWRAFHLSGYARVDFRVDDDGRIQVIEVNANPCIAPDAGFIQALLHQGLTTEHFVERIMAAGSLRAGVRS